MISSVLRVLSALSLLRFGCKPEIRVTAWATSPAKAESAGERDNLPERVEPGVVYRDVVVRWRATARLKED